MKYRKKPVVVEAVVWTGSNTQEISEFINNEDICRYEVVDKPIWDTDSLEKTVSLYINTLEGIIKASVNDYIIKGVNGEFYPCKPDIFEKTYDKVD